MSVHIYDNKFRLIEAFVNQVRKSSFDQHLNPYAFQFISNAARGSDGIMLQRQ